MAERARLLVVDDEASIRSFLRDALSGEYDVQTASDGIEGAEAIAAGDFAVALVDINMPRADGVQLLNSVHETGKQTEVVMLTAYASVDTAMEAVRLGAFDYLTKPARTHDIRRVVRNAVSKHRLARENRELLERLTEANRQLKQHVAHVEKVNEMTERLNGENAALAGSLRRLNEGLERRVEDATRDLGRANRLLKENYLATIKALASSIEMKDAYTRGHSIRVAEYSVAIARKMLMPEERIVLLHYVTILHDVGKIGIDERILTKPGALTEEEYATIKLHPRMGEKIVQSIDFLAPVRSVVRSHHEWWNGKGYPDGLSGDSIPLEARIVGVADSFDAMTSTRAYRPALSVAEALDRLRASAGIQFDPEIVRVFLSVAPELRREG